MTEIDFVAPIKALIASRPGEYHAMVLRLAKAEAVPDTAELRTISDLLADLGYPPERMQADIGRVHERERARAAIQKAAEMDREAQECNQRHKQLNSDALDLSPHSEKYRNMTAEAAKNRERAAFLIQEASDTRRWAQSDYIKLGGANGFKPMTDEEWSWASKTQADVDKWVEEVTELSRPAEFIRSV